MNQTLLFLSTLFAPYQTLPATMLATRCLASPALLSQWRAEGESADDIWRKQAQSAPFVLTPGGLDGAAKHALHQSKQWDVYVGVLPRYKGGREKRDVHCAAWLWCEIDGKAAGIAGAQELLETALCSSMPRPQIVVESGGGLHVYWRLAEPTELDTPGALLAFESALRRLAYAVGGLAWEKSETRRYTGKLKPLDAARPFADYTCCEVARILRIPGTFNHKPDRQRVVQMTVCELDAPRWSYEKWRAWLPPQPVSAPPVQKTAWKQREDGLRPLPQKTVDDLNAVWPDGQKYYAIRRILYTARSYGWDEGQMQMLADTFVGRHACDARQVNMLVQRTLHRVQPEAAG